MLPYNFNTWAKDYLDRAKARGVKVSNKNRRRLEGIHLRLAFEAYGESLDTLFRVHYPDELLREAILSHRSVFDLIPKSDAWVGGYITVPFTK